MDQLRLGSADDPIASAQADRVRAMLEARPEILACVDLVPVSPRTPTDGMRRLFGMLHDRLADAVACPVERLPADLPRGIVARAFLRDRSPLYRCVSRHAAAIAELPAGATVVTCDAVARAQILYRYPHLRVELAPSSGRILDKLGQGRWDAACLPAELLETGSLVRLQSHPVAASEVIPAVGLGGVAVLVRDEPPAAHDLVRELNDPAVALWIHLERMFVTEAAGIPDTVCTARAVGAPESIELTGMIAERDGRWCVSESATGPADQAEAMARRLAASCIAIAGKESRRDVAR